MNCEETRKLMREWFDEGLGPPGEAMSHVAVCADCLAYHERLLAIGVALRELPVEAPHKGLLARVQAGAAAERRKAAVTRRVACASAAVGLLVVAAIGWLYPLPVEPDLWHAEVLSWAPEVELAEVPAQCADYLTSTYESALAWIAQMPEMALQTPSSLSSGGVWLGAVAVFTALVAINGYQAANLQHLTNHSRR